MGLLARRRSSNRASQPAAAPAAASGAPAHSPRPLIRPEDLAGAPGWTQLPPTPPLLPPVPFVVSRSFSDDLVTWRAPEMQIGPLGHGVSDLAPQGTVSAVAVMDPEPLVRLDPAAVAPEGATLPLVHPSAGDTEEVPQQVELPFGSRRATPDIRTAASSGTPAPEAAAVTPEPASQAAPPMPLVPAPTQSSRPAQAASATVVPGATEARPAASDVQSNATAPAGEAHASTRPPAAAAAPVLRPFVESPVPPQLPLIQLKTAPVPTPAATVRADSPVELSTEAAGETLQVAPLLGDRPALEEPRADAPSGPDADHSVPETADSQPGLELAQPVGGPAQAAPVTTSFPPGAPTPADPARRSGLGAPLHDLPATAASLDAASLAASYARRPRGASNPAAQMPLAIAAATRSQPGPAGLPTPSAPRPTPAYAPPAPTYGETASLPLVVPEPERRGAPAGVLASSLPPAPEATVALTPFQPIAPAVAERSNADPGREGAALKAVVGRRHGVNLDDVTVDRSPSSAAKAQAMGADAFTSADRVVVPKSFGTLETGPGRALLAHELTHAAQQRQSGARALPAEHSPAGQTMEAAAIATELSFVSPGGAMPKLGAPPASAAGRGPAAPGIATTVSTPALPSSAGAASGPTVLPLARTESPSIDDGMLTAALLRLGALTGNAAAATPGASITVASGGAVSAPAAAPAPAAAAPVQHAFGIRSPFTSKPKSAPAQNAGPFTTRPSDADLAKLASWLYPLISFKMRRELKTDRERAGLLTDLYRR